MCYERSCATLGGILQHQLIGGGPQGFHEGGAQRVRRGPCFAMFFSILAGHTWKTCIYIYLYIVLCTRESPGLKLVFRLNGKQSSTVYLKDLIIQRFAVSFGSAL